MDEEFTRGMVILTGTKGSWTRNPPKEWDSAENYQLKDEKFT
jgi:hypothetical protein